MSATLIKNARIVNEGNVIEADLRIVGQRIERIEQGITAQPTDTIIEAKGKYLIPGMIDDQVHFREPGLTHKGSIASESRAAVAGGPAHGQPGARDAAALAEPGRAPAAGAGDAAPILSTGFTC